MSISVTAAHDWNLARTEARRRFVVRAVIFIYILSLLEGPLRKWFLPGLAGPLTLLRDPFVIALYAYAFLGGFMMRRGIAALWLGFAALSSWFGLVQFMANGQGMTGWVLGVRTYWLYVPLAFVVARAFQHNDVLSFLRLNLWIALPYALLVATQYNAGPGTFINLGVGGDQEGAIGVADSILRPFGLFTFTGPNVQFTVAMIAMFTAFFLAGRSVRPSLPAFAAMAAAVGTMSVLTGSRVIYFEVGVILTFTILGMVVARPTGTTLVRSLALVAFTAFSGLLLMNVFPDMFSAMQIRFADAAVVEGSLWNRIYYSNFRFIDALETAPLFGHGIGLGASGVTVFLNLPPLLFGEGDTERNVNELGLLLGVFFLLLRWYTTIWIATLAIRLARQGFLMALPLAGAILLQISFGSITNSPLNAFLVWLLVGIVMAQRDYGVKNGLDLAAQRVFQPRSELGFAADRERLKNRPPSA